MDNLEQEKVKRKDGWERDLLEKLASSSIIEQRRARRWGIFFKLLTFAYLVTLLVLWIPDMIPDAAIKATKEHTAIIEIKGVIADDSEASADNVITALRAAYEDKKTKGVILRINSPGGSAVQAGYINDEIQRLKAKHKDIPVYAVVTDMAASGGYYIAVAADEIYVDKASIVGSIGVLMSTFGFEKGMEKLGVERRLLTAGDHKGILDPFSPLKEEEKQHVQTMLDQVHQQFINEVKEGRGDRLKPNEKIFSGLFWSGEESINLGLADGLGSSSYVARELIKAETLVDYTQSEDIFERFAKRIGAGAAAFVSSRVGLEVAPSLR
ncbi:signal peptide peptidase SppA [Sedimenticola selenatireducens]|uniref:Signal peptide peptidase SppA n=1 Tax=Sedimenticola selenatireducens TaxID=191960 RepID=A0A557RUP5_9GAMM|nr:signal peptide peptidase SppA [Sedimenticola selenatireducens]TVO68883.1 signal peptide peptidase SppA [Sedimenticola selenatireducens]TVT61256.1 MAG: signal peptide peptidase SppA [Sedimenticola selenatireducens]